MSPSKVDHQKAEKIRHILQSRGPDGSGQYISQAQSTMLIHTRLAILDLNPRAQQPFTTQSGRFTLVYNGEIYNYLELREQLSRSGVEFITTSDTEVIAEGFERVGVDFIRKLEGMFSIGVHDNENRELWLFRDSFGIKPLLYYIDDEKFLFSTSAQAILAYEPRIQIDTESINDMLVNGFVIEPRSMYKDMLWLEHSAYMHVTAQRGVLEVNQHRFEPFDDEDTPGGLCEDIRQSIKMHEVSDVPVAATLSGGMDSGMIAWYADSISRFYTASYDTRLNGRDLASARNMAALCDTEHVVVPVTTEDYCYYMDDVKRYDVPCLEYSQIPLTAVYRKIKEDGYKVVLSGDGADELLFGYQYMRQLLKNRAGRKGLSAALESLAGEHQAGLTGKLFRRLGYYGQYDSTEQRHYEMLRGRVYRQILPFCQESERKAVGSLKEAYDRTVYHEDSWKSIRRAELLIGLRNKMLPKVDRASMAESVEVRVPFLSRLIWRNGGNVFGKGKVAAMRECLSEDARGFFRLAAKRGFNPPLQRWINESGLSSELSGDAAVFDVLGITQSGMQELQNALQRSDNTAAHTVHSLLVLNRFMNSH